MMNIFPGKHTLIEWILSTSWERSFPSDTGMQICEVKLPYLRPKCLIDCCKIWHVRTYEGPVIWICT